MILNLILNLMTNERVRERSFESRHYDFRKCIFYISLESRLSSMSLALLRFLIAFLARLLGALISRTQWWR